MTSLSRQTHVTKRLIIFKIIYKLVFKSKKLILNRYTYMYMLGRITLKCNSRKEKQKWMSQAQTFDSAQGRQGEGTASPGVSRSAEPLMCLSRCGLRKSPEPTELASAGRELVCNGFHKQARPADRRPRQSALPRRNTGDLATGGQREAD